MSGVTGNDKIQSRKDFKKIVKYAENLIKDFPGFISVEPTGSYNSDKEKTNFGDVDLITFIDGNIYDNDKKKIKANLTKYFTFKPNNIVVPFISPKYKGRRYYNSGEIITISLKIPNSSIEAAQVDFIIAMDINETKFKKDFLDMPADKQGLILGATKVALLEFNEEKILNSLDINRPLLENNQEIEFNCSSKEIQLRKVTYNPKLLEIGEFKTLKQEVLWTSRRWEDLQIILYKLDLSLSFNELIEEIRNTFILDRSLRRLKGVFKSMVSIKSGEVGKEKGINKQKSLDIIEKLTLKNI